MDKHFDLADGRHEDVQPEMTGESNKRDIDLNKAALMSCLYDIDLEDAIYMLHIKELNNE